MLDTLIEKLLLSPKTNYLSKIKFSFFNLMQKLGACKTAFNTDKTKPMCHMY